MKKELICSKLEKEGSCAASTSSSSNFEVDSSQGSPASSASSSFIQTNIEKILEVDIRSKLSMCALLFPLGTEEKMLEATKNPNKRIKYEIGLNAQEKELLKEVEQATEAAAFYDENRLQVIGEVTDLIYALNLAELYIKKTIRFCKSVSAFRCINQEDQLLILKSFFTELMIVRFAFVFNPEKDGYPVIEVSYRVCSTD